MKNALGAHCDDFFTSCRLFMKLDLTLERETTLHFFDRIRREYPAMRRFRRREGDNLVLEENDPQARDDEPQRWIRLEPRSLRFGFLAPQTREECRQYGNFILEQAPFHLTLSDLDIDMMEVVYGFDLEYCGNHDQLMAEALFPDHPFTSFLMGDEAVHSIDCQPYFGIALSPECDLQAYLELKSRTSSFEVRTGEYDPQLLSIYLTVRRYWGYGQEDYASLVAGYNHLADWADNLAVNRVIPSVVNPLALAIASRS